MTKTKIGEEPFVFLKASKTLTALSLELRGVMIRPKATHIAVTPKSKKAREATYEIQTK